ncbi:MAG: nucleotidyltransferase family protein [Ruminococcaceae bacterium]|nr:nucleotidyltransferase family protein [Oscillospiraceae bacterium]
MKISGIICEYNPFHTGHEYLIKEAKKRSDAVVCVMSGHFTQRGEAAIADKFVRAKTALLGGADLVLELPFPFSAASASYFAAAGVKLLSMVGADRLVFGSESGEITRLLTLADHLLSADFEKKKEKMMASEGSALAHFGALLGERERLLPNDILAVEYLRAIKKEGLPMEAVAVSRVGDGFLQKELGDSPYASATALRQSLYLGDLAAMETYMPKYSLAELKEALTREEAPVTTENAARAILGFFRLIAPEALSEIAGLGNGLEQRICASAKESRDLAEFLQKCATKRYTDAAIRRAILAAMTGVTYADLDRGAVYTTVLGANATGRALLASLRKKKLPLLTKPSDVEVLCLAFPEKKDAILRQAALSESADALYSLCLPRVTEAGKYLRSGAVML